MFKEYTTPRLQIKLVANLEDLQSDTQFFVALLGRNGEIRKEAALEGDLLNVDLTQQETAKLGAGQVFIEVTCIKEGRVTKSNTIRAECEGAILKEIYTKPDTESEVQNNV